MFGGNRGRGSGAQNGDFNGIHHCQGITVRSIAENNQPLDIGHSEALSVIEKVAVEFRGKVRRGRAEQRRLDVEASIPGWHAQNFGCRTSALAMMSKGVFDCNNTFIEGKKSGNIGSGKQ